MREFFFSSTCQYVVPGTASLVKDEKGRALADPGSRCHFLCGSPLPTWVDAAPGVILKGIITSKR
jgi:hypothetical protein